MELLPGLIRKGVHVGLVCRPNTPLAAMFSGMNINVYPVEKSGAGGFRSFFEIARIIRDNGYQAVCIQRGHDILQSWISALLSGRRPKLIYTVHVADFLRSRFLLNRMDHIITISRHIVGKLAAYAPSLTTRTKVIHHGIDLTAFNPARAKQGFIRNRFGLSPHTPLISSSGSMWKNQIEFLDALVEIRKELPDVRYLLLTPMADIPQLREFKVRARRLDLLGSILWLDTVPKGDMPSYFADLDLAISTFRNEGFGIWVVEALAMGTPVVAFDEGGVRDSLENCPAGVLIKNGAREMAVEVIRILKDPGTRKAMSDAGPRWVAEHFSTERMVNDYYLFLGTLN